MCLLASLLALKSGDNGECSVPMDIYYGLNVCVPPHSYVEILMPSVMVCDTQSVVSC